MLLLLAVVGSARSDAACPADTFKSSTNLSLCANLTAQPAVASLAACRALCCAEAQCGVYQWCPNNGERLGGCAHWAGARCHTGPAPSAACPWAAHWVGETKQALPSPPPSPGPPSPSPSPRRSPASRKQGFSGFLGPDYSCEDARALGLADSWYYTWMMNSAQYGRCESPADQAAEFVPMVNGIGQLDTGLTNHYQTEWRAANAHYLLGYNEPDPGNGHNHPHMVSPAAAAKDWVHVQAAAKLMDLKLVSPAVSTTGLDDHGVSPWFDQFFGNCSIVPGCDASQIECVWHQQTRSPQSYHGGAALSYLRVLGGLQVHGLPRLSG